MNTTITRQDLKDKLGEVYCQSSAGLYISCKIKCLCLRKLDISGLGLGDPSVSRLADALKSNPPLEVLNLSHNKIADAAGELAIAVLFSKSLKNIDISFNEIEFTGLQAFKLTLLHHPKLETLILQGNKGCTIEG